MHGIDRRASWILRVVVAGLAGACGPGTGSEGSTGSATGSTGATGSSTGGSSDAGTEATPTSSGGSTSTTGGSTSTTSGGSTSGGTSSGTEATTGGVSRCEAAVGVTDCAVLVTLAEELTLELCTTCQGACGTEPDCDGEFPCVDGEIVVQGCCSDEDCAGLSPFCGMFIAINNVCVVSDDL